MKKLFLGLFLTILFIFGVGLYTQKRSIKPIFQVTKPVENKIEISIDYGDGKIISSSYNTALTAFDLLNKLAQENNIEIKTKQYDFGVFVESIGGKPNTKEKAWIYLINGKSGDVAADKYILKPEDKIEWKYTEPIF